MTMHGVKAHGLRKKQELNYMMMHRYRHKLSSKTKANSLVLTTRN